MDEITQYVKKLSLNDKKQNGIFLTPQQQSEQLINDTFNLISINQSKNILNILEPSFGGGVFIKNVIKKCQNDFSCNIYGIEQNKELYQKYQTVLNQTVLTDKVKVQILQQDFINFQTEMLYDIIIGNPPYFIMTKQQKEKEQYQKLIEQHNISGKSNIFELFLIKSLLILKPYGFISFILPSAFLSTTQYETTRHILTLNGSIKNIKKIDNTKFTDTKYELIQMIYQKHDTFQISINNNVILTYDKDKIQNILDQAKCFINDLDVNVLTGNVVWNQHKQKMTTDETKKLIIYPNNIQNNRFTLKNVQFQSQQKTQYIDIDCVIQKPIIVINRGNGNTKYVFKYCLINDENTQNQICVENHLYYIQGDQKTLNRILQSFKNELTKEYVELFFQNGAINQKEIQYMLPIFI